MEISKAESGCRQGVDVWGVVDGTPVAAKVAVAEVIGHDEDDVGSGEGRGGKREENNGDGGNENRQTLSHIARNGLSVSFVLIRLSRSLY